MHFTKQHARGRVLRTTDVYCLRYLRRSTVLTCISPVHHGYDLFLSRSGSSLAAAAASLSRPAPVPALLRYAALNKADIPKTECLKDTIAPCKANGGWFWNVTGIWPDLAGFTYGYGRLLPFWYVHIFSGFHSHIVAWKYAKRIKNEARRDVNIRQPFS